VSAWCHVWPADLNFVELADIPNFRTLDLGPYQPAITGVAGRVSSGDPDFKSVGIKRVLLQAAVVERAPTPFRSSGTFGQVLDEP
jgi:hypothetical protein